ncbi:glycosyltransferase [Methanobrevibacter sp.]|uniref:glycosyltransferase n=1 Tax=Methanobrevibacter sp. TaxID=66852 RepID=UPI00388DC57D
MFKFVKDLFNKHKSLDYSDLKNINIAYVLANFPSLSQTFVINEIRWLVENGYNIKVISFSTPDVAANLDFEVENIRFDENADCHEDLVNNLERILIENDIQLIHTHFVYPIGTVFIHPMIDNLKIPFTIFAHAADIFRYWVDEANNVGAISQNEYCKAIFTLGNFHKNYLMERDVLEEKIVITKQASNYDIEEIELNSNNPKKIVSICRYTEKKGLDDLIDIAKLLENENCEFSVYGFGELKEELQNKVKELNLSNITINDELKGAAEVKKVLRQSDLLVSPCKRASDGDMDGIPTILFEAMGYGTPVLTTDVSSIPEIIDDGVNGFIVEANNKEAFKDRINEIMALDEDELLKIRKKAQEDVQEISGVDKTMEIVTNTWKNIK